MQCLSLIHILTLTDEDDNSVTLSLAREKELARTPQEENLKTQLAKFGNTPFEAVRIDIDFAGNWFCLLYTSGYIWW